VRITYEVACHAVVRPVLTGRIAFYSDRDGDFEVYLMNADGSAQIRLTTHPGFDGVPALSPDGTRILFEMTRDGNSEIYLINADGTEPVSSSACWK
jgi:Tol biopolymer transport system component